MKRKGQYVLFCIILTKKDTLVIKKAGCVIVARRFRCTLLF